jgi:hypothetical protein
LSVPISILNLLRNVCGFSGKTASSSRGQSCRPAYRKSSAITIPPACDSNAEREPFTKSHENHKPSSFV